MALFDSRFSSGQHVPPFHYGDGATLSINRTIRTQGEIWLTGLANRGSASLNPSTTARYTGALHNWIYPVLGDLNLSRVNHASLRPLVQQMFDAGFSTSTIKTYVRIVQVIVASFTDLNGEEVYPRRWHSTLLGLPGIHGGQRSAPCFSSDLVTAIVNYEKSPRERTLFILAAASGARIGELLGLEIGTHISPDCTTLRIRTRNSMREVDLHPTVGSLLRRYIAGRTSGLLFSTLSGKPLHLANILKHHLHPALQSLGYLNPVTGKCMAGTHAFRRYRITYLFQCDGLPERLRNYWMGRSSESTSWQGDQVHMDRAFRRQAWAERCGFGFDLPCDAGTGLHDSCA